MESITKLEFSRDGRLVTQLTRDAQSEFLTTTAASVALHAHGFNDEDIWDIAAITAFFGLSNRMASFSGMLPNPEFYLMGRLPKAKPA